MNPARTPFMLVVAAAGALALAACSADHPSAQHATSTPTSSPTTSAAGAAGATGIADADVAFAQFLLGHDEQAARMATLAAARSARPQIKQIAKEILGQQRDLAGELTGLLRSWNRPTPPPGHDHMHSAGNVPAMASAEEMAKLAAAHGNDFDRLFARMMISHHNGVIQMCRAHMGSPTVKQLADRVERSRTSQVEALQVIADEL